MENQSCQFCGLAVYNIAEHLQYCKNYADVPVSSQIWVCPKCGSENHPDTTECAQCTGRQDLGQRFGWDCPLCGFFNNEEQEIMQRWYKCEGWKWQGCGLVNHRDQKIWSSCVSTLVRENSELRVGWNCPQCNAVNINEELECWSCATVIWVCKHCSNINPFNRNQANWGFWGRSTILTDYANGKGARNKDWNCTYWERVVAGLFSTCDVCGLEEGKWKWGRCEVDDNDEYVCRGCGGRKELVLRTKRTEILRFPPKASSNPSTAPSDHTPYQPTEWFCIPWGIKNPANRRTCTECRLKKEKVIVASKRDDISTLTDSTKEYKPVFVPEKAPLDWWYCGNCQVYNKNTRITCEECRMKRVKVELKPNEMPELTLSNWKWIECFMDNKAISQVCVNWGTNRFKPMQDPKAPVAQAIAAPKAAAVHSVIEEWLCGPCNVMNAPARRTCANCWSKREKVIKTQENKVQYLPKRVNWTCLDCNTENPMEKAKCLGCKQAREHVEDTRRAWVWHTWKYKTSQDQRIWKACHFDRGYYYCPSCEIKVINKDTCAYCR